MQTNFPRTGLHQLARMAMGATLVIGASAARAEYVVINEDLLPTAVVEARRAQHAAPAAEKHSVLFQRGRSPLIPAGRQALALLIPQIGDGVVRIVGRTDNRRYATIPRKRANNMRDYLIRHGVSVSKIIVEVDNTPNLQSDGDFFASEIHIVRRAAPATAYAAGSGFAHTPTVAPNATALPASYVARHESNADFVMLQDFRPQQQSAPETAPSTRDEKLLIYIAESVKSGKLDASVAVRMLEHLAGAQANKGTALSAVIEKRVPNDYQVFTDASVDVETPIQFDTKTYWLDGLTKGAAAAGIEVTINMTKKVIRLTRASPSPQTKPIPTTANRISYAQTYTGK